MSANAPHITATIFVRTCWEHTNAAVKLVILWTQVTKKHALVSPLIDTEREPLHVCMCVSVTIFLRDGQTDLRQTFRGSSVSVGKCFRQKTNLNILKKVGFFIIIIIALSAFGAM